ncbi:hypothetical protein [Roseicyclus mahoneyensis]|jgi:hypothetical protein|uniref:Uncharacterized protein n=1 Tax=Roseicyclus mahoneyensis TaxID=164332 RepID=A0A316GEB3_9RHOB|nr:hypothetical protein [Roseicyclus mahoneyensis]PWK59339.1 hypothetical protein C7455_108107 [Roseicyclus mahoneyensis]
MMLHAPLALLAVLFAYSLATASPEASGPVTVDRPLVLMTFAALR